MTDQELLTLVQAAEIAKCDPRTLRNAIEAKTLRAKLYGKTYLVTSAELNHWLDTPEYHKRGPRKKLS